MRHVLAVAAVAATSLMLTAGAQAGNPVTTQVDIELFQPASGRLFAVGTLSAGDERCIPDRTVEIYIKADNKAPVPIDTARTADRGGWMGFRKISGLPQQQYTELLLVVPKTKVKVSKHKQITCGGKTRSYALAG